MKEVKVMKNFPGENGNLSDSSIFKARIKESELISQEKLQEIQGAADELARQSVINKLRQAEVEYEKLRLKLEEEASDRVEDILSHVELSAAENEDNFTSGIDGLLAKLFKFFNFMDSELGVETDPQVYSIIKEREKKQVWIAAVIKFLRDKFNKLIKAISSRDLSFQQKIDKEIKELYEKLFSGSLSPEEEAAILERLEALRDLKLKLQIFVVGTIIKMFAELFSVELTASVETTKEEGKEKTSAKEATKEVHENLEIKVDAKEKPTVPVSLFDFSSGVARPITLSKPELDLLRDPIKKIVELPPKPAINNENIVVPKPEVKGKQENENKKAIQPAQEPKEAAPPKKEPGKVSGVTFDSGNVERHTRYGINFSKSVETRTTSTNRYSITSSISEKESKSTGRYETDDLGAKLAVKVAERNARKKCAEASNKHDYPIDHFQVPVGNNGKSHAGAENKPQQSSVDNAQPTGECRDVKVNNHVESIGKAPEEASRGI
ncbi:MAG: hypothetical protein LKM45_03530 [Wolbachia endosymbiont of Alcedoecus sp.]|nr:hypothetical protein [Wolbachia endosymbiont of Alcedoecus sp.]